VVASGTRLSDFLRHFLMPMPSIFSALFPIFAALLLGAVGAKGLPRTLRTCLIRLITPLVWLLLLAVGFEFGNVLDSVNSVAHTVGRALVFASLTTAIPWAMISMSRMASGTESGSDASTARALGGPRASYDLGLMIPPLRECAIALLMVAVGVGAHWLFGEDWLHHLRVAPATVLLYSLLFLVGLDLSDVSLNRSWFSRRTLSVPLLVVIGSLLGGVVASYLEGETVRTALALSSGFGWFSLSGVVVGRHLGDAYGAVALMIDLFRELMAVMLLYSLGGRCSRACIGASGATALDSTLPIIKLRCQPADVPTALMSGLVLTLAAPFFMTFFLGGQA
jgi:uncharacterized membrane protein YbjE (DUF340 family)